MNKYAYPISSPIRQRPDHDEYEYFHHPSAMNVIKDEIKST